MVEIKEDIDYNEVLYRAERLCNFVIDKYNIKTLDDWQCPYFRALAEELYYWEEEDEGR